MLKILDEKFVLKYTAVHAKEIA